MILVINAVLYIYSILTNMNRLLNTRQSMLKSKSRSKLQVKLLLANEFSLVKAKLGPNNIK